jgi:hypothetical protein
VDTGDRGKPIRGDSAGRTLMRTAMRDIVISALFSANFYGFRDGWDLTHLIQLI